MSQTLAGTNIAFTPVNVEARKKLEIKSGDTVRVHQKIQEKGKTRIQVFEGLVLSVKHGTEPGSTFTVRKVASGVGVEKTFPLYSPIIDKIEITKRSKVRRAKLYYIREKAAKEIRSKIRQMILGTAVSTASFEKEAEEKEKADLPADEAGEQSEEVSEEKTVEKTEESSEEQSEPEVKEESKEEDK